MVNELDRLRARVVELEGAEAERQRVQETLLARVQQQAAVADLGVRALAASDLDVLFADAVNVLVETLGVDFAKVLELLPDGRELRLRAGVGWRAGLVGQGTVSAGMESQAGYTLASSMPVIVGDLRTESRFHGPPLLTEHGVVSGMSVIIHGQDGPWGVLGTHTRERRTFTRDDDHFLQTVANVLAAAIARCRSDAEQHRLRLQEARTRREAKRVAEQAAERLRDLRAVTDPHLTEQAISDLLQRLLNRVMTLLQVDTADILLPDAEGYLTSRAASGLEGGGADRIRIPPGEGIAGRIAASDEAIVIEDLATVEVVNPILRESGVRSLVGVPLKIGSRRGVLHAGTLDPRQFTAHDVHLLQDIADLVGAALNQVRQVVAGQQDHGPVEASCLLETARDEDATLQTTARLAVPDLGDFCIVYAVGQNRRIRRAAIAHANDGDEAALLEATDGFDVAVDGRTGAIFEVLRTGRAALVPRVDEELLRGLAMDDDHRHRLSELRPESAMIVPLVARGRAIGTMTCVSTSATRQYGPADIALAEGLARYGALAIDNARLFRDMRAAEERYRNLFERVGDAMLLFGPDGRYLDANPAACELLGYSRQEFRRMRAGDQVAGDREWGCEQFDRVRGDGSWRGEAELRCKDGRSLPMEGQIQRVDLPEGHAYIGIWRDISGRRAVEALQREFMESVSHDLQTPLTALSAAISLLGMGAAERLDQGERELLGNARRNAERLRQLIADLLTYNEVRSGSLQLHCERLDLRDLVQDAVAAMAPVTHEADLDVNVDLPEPLHIHGDQRRLEQVITNILMNAHRHTPPGTRVMVTGKQRGNRV
ncbi:MAG: GAF domain-containing protein, partial [Chloroflexota bacterium]|nr:GAF domain-containing protein [Chloroflexota bacterium]